MKGHRYYNQYMAQNMSFLYNNVLYIEIEALQQEKLLCCICTLPNSIHRKTSVEEQHDLILYMHTQKRTFGFDA